MKIVIPAPLVPDLVEELTVDETGAALDKTWLSWILNEFDNHAIEQGILLKERYGGEVTVLGLDGEGTDDMLFTAAARGADHLIRLTGDISPDVNNHAWARMLADALEHQGADLVLTGIQTHTDLDGQMGPLLAEHLGYPYIGYVAGITVAEGSVTVRKEYPGGLVAEMKAELPAVLGIQAADQPPRYVAISRVRQMMKTTALEDRVVEMPASNGGPVISRMYPPETGKKATMLEGDLDEVASHLVRILVEARVIG